MDKDAIRALRSRLGLTQMEMAARIGTTVTTISRWETGARSPTGLYDRALRELAAAPDARAEDATC